MSRLHLTRTPEEIVARIDSLFESDAFGWSRELLFAFLPFEHAKPFLKDGVTAEQWDEENTPDPRDELIDYLPFAWEKCNNERGISATRSVDKIEQWLWLMGDDALLGRFLSAPFAPYGRPQLRVVTEALAPELLDEVSV